MQSKKLGCTSAPPVQAASLPSLQRELSSRISTKHAGQRSFTFEVIPIAQIYQHPFGYCVTVSRFVHAYNLSTLVSFGENPSLGRRPSAILAVDSLPVSLRQLREAIAVKNGGFDLIPEFADMLESKAAYLNPRLSNPGIRLDPFNIMVRPGASSSQFELVITDLCADVRLCAV